MGSLRGGGGVSVMWFAATAMKIDVGVKMTHRDKGQFKVRHIYWPLDPHGTGHYIFRIRFEAKIQRHEHIFHPNTVTSITK